MQSRYLIRRDGRYYFRIRVPLDLRRWFGPKEEIKKSLKTNGYNDARSLARAWLYRSERLFTRLSSAMVTDDQIKKLVTDYLDETLSESEERRLGGGGLYADDGDGEHDLRNRLPIPREGHWRSFVSSRGTVSFPNVFSRNCLRKEKIPSSCRRTNPPPKNLPAGPKGRA